MRVTVSLHSDACGSAMSARTQPPTSAMMARVPRPPFTTAAWEVGAAGIDEEHAVPVVNAANVRVRVHDDVYRLPELRLDQLGYLARLGRNRWTLGVPLARPPRLN